MYKKRKLEVRYIVILILVGITLVLGGLFYAFHENRTLTIIEKAVHDTGLFIEKIIYTPVQWGKDLITSWQEKKEMYEKYEVMREHYEEYNALEAKYKEIHKELEEMEQMLELNVSLSEGTYVNATAITRNVDYWYQTLSLDRGQKHDVGKGFAVVNARGLIGYIDSVSNYYSTVKLLTAEDVQHKISIKIEVGDSFVFGLLTLYDADKNVFQIEGISENTGIPKGSLVTTTGLGNVFPSGLVIGTVDSIYTDHFELAKTVYVKPAVDFNDINYVTILKREGAL